MAVSAPVPTELYKKLVRAEQALDDLRDAFEDCLIAQSPRLLKKLTKSHEEDLSGKTRPFSEFMKELGI